MNNKYTGTEHLSIAYRCFSRLIKILPAKIRISILFFRRFHKLPDLNSPKTFNEKINWRKLHEKEELFAISVDKLASKHLVKHIYPKIKTPSNLWIGNTINNGDIDSLVPPFVIKASQGSQMNIIVMTSEELDSIDIPLIFQNWSKIDISSTLDEWAYGEMPRKYFIEEYLNFNGGSPTDYKFFVYSGSVKYIQVDSDRQTFHTRNMMTKDWRDLGIDFSHPRKVPIPDKPVLLEKMIKIAETIGDYYTFIRVDLYEHDDDVFFSELTLYPGAGYEVFTRLEHDIEFGIPWNISSKPKISLEKNIMKNIRNRIHVEE